MVSFSPSSSSLASSKQQQQQQQQHGPEPTAYFPRRNHVGFLEAQVASPTTATPLQPSFGGDELVFRRPGSPAPPAAGAFSRAVPSKPHQKGHTFASIFAMPATPRILPLGNGCAPSSTQTRSTHVNNRVVSQPEVRIKQNTTLASGKRVHGSFDDSRYITSMSDPRLTQMLEYAPHSGTTFNSGIVMHDPLNRPLSPANSSQQRTPGQRSNSPSPPLSRATPSPFLIPPPCQPPPAEAIPINRSESDTPESECSNFSNFTASFASPRTTSPSASDLLRTSPSRWYNTVGQYSGRTYDPHTANISISNSSSSGGNGFLSANDAVAQWALLRRPAHRLIYPHPHSRGQSTRPASTDPDDVRLPSRLGHKRKTSLQENPVSIVRPKHANVPAVQVDPAVSPCGTEILGRPWDLTPQQDHKRTFIDDGQFGSRRHVGKSSSSSSALLGPPPGMPSWVHLPISDAFKPIAKPVESPAVDKLQSSLDSAIEVLDDAVFCGPDLPAEPAASTLSSSIPSIGDAQAAYDLPQTSGPDSQAVHALHAVLHSASGPKGSRASPAMSRSGSASTHRPALTRDASADSRHALFCWTEGVTSENRPLSIRSPVDSASLTLSPKSESGPIPDSSKSHCSSMNIFIGAPQLRGLIDSPLLRSRAGTPVSDGHRSERTRLLSNNEEHAYTRGGRELGGSHIADGPNGVYHKEDDELRSGTAADGDEVCEQLQLEIARRCTGSVAMPQLTLNEPDMQILLPKMRKSTVTTEGVEDLGRGTVSHQTISPPAHSDPQQSSCRPPLQIIRPTPIRSSSSPLAPLETCQILPCPTGMLASELSPLSSKSSRRLKQEQEQAPSSSEDRHAGDEASLLRKKSLVERRRLSTGAPLELPTLSFTTPAKRAAAQKSGSSQDSSAGRASSTRAKENEPVKPLRRSPNRPRLPASFYQKPNVDPEPGPQTSFPFFSPPSRPQSTPLVQRTAGGAAILPKGLAAEQDRLKRSFGKRPATGEASRCKSDDDSKAGNSARQGLTLDESRRQTMKSKMTKTTTRRKFMTPADRFSDGDEEGMSSRIPVPRASQVLLAQSGRPMSPTQLQALRALPSFVHNASEANAYAAQKAGSPPSPTKYGMGKPPGVRAIKKEHQGRTRIKSSGSTPAAAAPHASSQHLLFAHFDETASNACRGRLRSRLPKSPAPPTLRGSRAG
ncbi:hypothetical protein OC835_002593 [Tilletia horrida]|nr:hypothetical protein OC835_002593 [Tilletia horrida]